MKSSSITVGIDLGTTNSLVAIWNNGKSQLLPNALGEVLTPSVVSIDEDGTILVGQVAKERLQTHPLRTAAAFKRGMGTATSYKLGERVFRAEELSAILLQALRKDAIEALKCDVHSAVITVPAYFSDAQREATRNAGLIAGFENVTLLNEPTAAALAYGLHQEKPEGTFLVFDFGGGTFDVSVLEMFEGVMEVRATAGDNQLGGEDADSLIRQYFVEKSSIPAQSLQDPIIEARLRARCEQAKRHLAVENSVNIQIRAAGEDYRATLSLEQLDVVLKPLLTRLRTPVEQAMRDARLQVSSLDAVVLAGGSTRLASVRQLVTRMFGRFPDITMNPDEVIALGAAVQAGLKEKDQALSERVMTDVCPYTLGVETSKEIRQGQYTPGYMAPILDRNTVIPASRVQRFWPIHAEQREMRISVYQGEGRRVEQNIALGSFNVPMQIAKDKPTAVDVRFTYDVNGLLEVEATSMLGEEKQGEAKRLVVQSGSTRLSEAEIQEHIARLRDLKTHPRDRLESRTLLARAERVYAQLIGTEREQLSICINQYEYSLNIQDPMPIEKNRQHLIEILNAVEHDRLLGE
jgi:molecular chaperone HscC